MRWGKDIAVELIRNAGLSTPFVNVSVSGLLWGYHDELPCLKLSRPSHCPVQNDYNLFETEYDDDEDDWDEWKRKKRETGWASHVSNDLRNLNFTFLQRPNPEIQDCKCKWGLFRHRNVTLRQPRTIHHGHGDQNMRGWLKDIDSSTTLNFWKTDSLCDQVGGQDGAVFSPFIKETDVLDMFLSPMYRR